ncbi:MAG TPA: helix-turn-helix domain-containing protein, partial [Thermomicrobiaceae bacterium]|nr:helix-turn-helix domain-containing protein [Thermomicrobiaceae bacterium]
LLDLLYQRPLVNATVVQKSLPVSKATAGSLIRQFEQLGIIEEITGARRRRRFRYSTYLALFEEQPPGTGDAGSLSPTQSAP